ncbi:MAG TPA: DUF742 domain-containing protein [Amycolatopsis sp.]|uniref:DUF742 domain-containing protein n=1 Tax=Amycolatopsis sp. TaxID=37632 RepID=UPI002B486A28|nr:DUF742 domain-containing protein [Amycolatopsis sp.]HKS45155.1 DUF742 domain-containing protein [Amycolatopsis sp.]
MEAGLESTNVGDERASEDASGDEPRNTSAEEDWTSFRARVDREWRQRRARNSREEDASDPAHGGPDDYRDRLLSGPAAELFGDSSCDSEFTAFPPASPGPMSHPSLPPVPPVPAETSGLVRPYFRTGGRTRPSQDLAVEALVSTSERGRALGRVRVPEHRSICSLCLDTRSVAEVAAYLRLPLGVVRVLIGDVASLGLVLVHSATSVVGDRPSIEFMERVLSGLRRI